MEASATERDETHERLVALTTRYPVRHGEWVAKLRFVDGEPADVPTALTERRPTWVDLVESVESVAAERGIVVLPGDLRPHANEGWRLEEEVVRLRASLAEREGAALVEAGREIRGLAVLAVSPSHAVRVVDQVSAPAELVETQRQLSAAIAVRMAFVERVIAQSRRTSPAK